ncbi:MAG: preprotein translocase subunit SecG [Deltaproteobacteria bacterium]|nr:MAG: preprotein translocase subunit SecG [Deltaproteobacteria bacterium]
MEIAATIVTVLYVLVTLLLIVVVLLQAGRGGGMGTALGGGASQAVFGGSGGADFMARLTQGLAAAFMVFAVFLAYAGAHTGSSRLQEASKEDTPLLAADAPIDWERIGPNPLPLPDPAEAEAKRKAFEAKLGDVPPDEAEGSESTAPTSTETVPADAATTGDAPLPPATGDAPTVPATGDAAHGAEAPAEDDAKAPGDVADPRTAPDAAGGSSAG